MQSAPEQSSKNGKVLLLYLAKKILFGPVFEASLQSWAQLYRLNSLLSLSWHLVFYCSYKILVSLREPGLENWDYNNVHPCWWVCLDWNRQVFLQRRMAPFLLKHGRVSPAFQKLIFLTLYRQLLPKLSSPFLGNFMEKLTTQAIYKCS